MGSHSNDKLKTTIYNAAETATMMSALETQLEEALHLHFKEKLGIDVPTMLEVTALSDETMVQYSQSINVDEFTSGANRLIRDAVGENYVALASDIVDLVSQTVQAIVGEGSLSIKTVGESIKTIVNGKQFILASYASYQLCKSTQWNVDTDFYASAYICICMTQEEAEALRKKKN